MKVRVGQIIDHYADFHGGDLHLMGRYIVLSTVGELIKVYILMENITGYDHKDIIPGVQRPGEIEFLSPHIFESQEESTNNFYWKIQE